MKKKILIIMLPIIAFSLVALLLFGMLFTQKIYATNLNPFLKTASKNKAAWQKADKGFATISNENYIFTMDVSNGHFTVKDSSSGTVYRSALYETDDDGKSGSELIIKYYDANSTLLTMNTYKNSAIGKNFEVETDGEKIKIIYSIQKSKIRTFVPTVISKKTYEDKIIAKLESGKRRRLKLFYTLYDSQDKDDETKEMLSKFPALKNEQLYILNDSATDSTFAEITMYMDESEYKSEDYSKELKRLKLENVNAEGMPAAFTVPVEYSLDKNGFKASVLYDEIKNHSTQYTLTDIDLLPYFSCVTEKSEGWMLVPDGSGAIIDLGEKNGVNYTQKIYGNDPSIEKDRQSAVIQNAGLPIFAMKSKEKSFFAVIEQGEATASVNAEVFGNEFLQSRIYPSFNCKAVDISDAGSLRKQGALNLYAKDYVAENPTVYYFLLPDKSTYSSMAVKYREYLKNNKSLNKRLSTKNLLTLDFIGYETVKSSFMGIPINKKLIFSDLKGINKSLDYLEKSGLSGINVRLKGYSDGGIYSMVQNGFSIDRSVGSKKELKSLSERLKDQNGMLYLENSISTVLLSGNGFNKMTHAVRNLKKTVAKGIDYDLVSRTENEAALSYMLTSPVYFEHLTKEFTETLGGEAGEIRNYGYSRSDFGSKLWSDFNPGLQIDRCISAKLSENAVKAAAGKFSGIMTDGSNKYALDLTDNLLNIPLGSSEFSCESYTVPFYQMVIHGYKNFSGSAQNISQDSEKNYLQSLESGASLYYSFYTNGEVSLKESGIGTLTYPTEFSSWADKVTERYKEFESVFADVYDQEIVSHTKINKTLSITEYENGKRIAVNYSQKAEEINGVNVPARGYAIVSKKGEQK